MDSYNLGKARYVRNSDIREAAIAFMKERFGEEAISDVDLGETGDGATCAMYVEFKRPTSETKKGLDKLFEEFPDNAGTSDDYSDIDLIPQSVIYSFSEEVTLKIIAHLLDDGEWVSCIAVDTGIILFAAAMPIEISTGLTL